MRAVNLLSVLALMCSAVGGAPFGDGLLEGETKEVLRHERVGSRNSSSPLDIGPEIDPRYVSSDTPLPGDIQIAVINATPYAWRRSYLHNWQLAGWGNPGREHKSRWPEVIQPGQSHRYWVANRRYTGVVEDTGGEVRFELEGTEKPMSFEIQFDMTAIDRFEVRVQFLGELTTKTTQKSGRILIANAKSASLPAGVHPDRAGCSFHIAGNEGDFTSTTDWNNPDRRGWMQELLPAIGHYPLKEITMPRSHHAALDTTKDGYELHGASAYAGQSVTQSLPIWDQLDAEGVRILDERVFYSRHQGFIHGHMKPHRDTGYKAGSTGRRLIEVIEAINNFNDRSPGELIFWDFHYLTYDFTKKNAAFSQKRRQELYNLIKDNLKHRAQLPMVPDPDYGYSNIKLNDLIGNHTSAVICRFNGWEGLPGPEEGFVNTENFPVDDHWSAEYGPENLFNDQLEHLDSSDRHGIAHGTQFLRSLDGSKMEIPESMTLTYMARELMTWFRYQFWNSLTHHKYPNWLSLDGFEGGEAKGFIIAINKCFVARQCGDWTEKRRPIDSTELC